MGSIETSAKCLGWTLLTSCEVDLIDQLFPETIQWEGLAPLESTIVSWTEPTAGPKGGLNAVYFVSREGALATAIGVLAALDEYAPQWLKGEAYYVILGTVFLASARPFDPVYIPKKYERLVDAIKEEPEQLRRTVSETQLIGTLANREEIKLALRFLCDKKVLEPLGRGEYLIARRPLKKLRLV